MAWSSGSGEWQFVYLLVIVRFPLNRHMYILFCLHISIYRVPRDFRPRSVKLLFTRKDSTSLILTL